MKASPIAVAATEAVGTSLIVAPQPFAPALPVRMAAMQPGESLGAFLARQGVTGSGWVVSVGGIDVPAKYWPRIKVKHGQVIEARAVVRKQVLAVIAIAVISYFTFGAGGMAAGSFMGMTGAMGYIAAGVVFMAGSALISKMLGPPSLRGPDAKSENPTYSLSGGQNTARPYEPLTLVLGQCKLVMDYASQPYTWFEGDDQYMSVMFAAGINCASYSDMRIGETSIEEYQDVTVTHTGFPGEASATPATLMESVDSIGGALLQAPDGSVPGAYTLRTSSVGTARLAVDLSAQLYEMDKSGKFKPANVEIDLEYRLLPSGGWKPLGETSPLTLTNARQAPLRRTIARDVPIGQYEVRARKVTKDSSSSTASNQVSWDALKSYQPDKANYGGQPRLQVKIKASGQLNGALNNVSIIAKARPVKYFDGSSWIDSSQPGAKGISNPGAQILQLLRGIYRDDGKLLAGAGLADTRIDLESLGGFIQHCAAKNYTCDMVVQQAMSLGELLEAIAACGMGSISRATGKWGVTWFAADQPIQGVVNMSNIRARSFSVSYDLAATADELQFEYFDKAMSWTWQPVRVQAPGVGMPQSTARASLLGITRADHAASLARFAMAQNIYGRKSITWEMDLEYLTYRRGALVSLSHDLTQWGYGGRVLGMAYGQSSFTVTLDDAVSTSNQPLRRLGLRLAGENTMRVFPVSAVSPDGRQITVSQAWPSGLEKPGEKGPAHDALWMFDFKETPGYRVRIVSIQPVGQDGARLTAVPESAEFWQYVESGKYTPPPNNSLLALDLPVVSGLVITAEQIRQGEAWVTQLTATWNVSGNYMLAQFWAAPDGSPMVRIGPSIYEARFSWVASLGQTWHIEVRPFDGLGRAGTSAFATYGIASGAPQPVTGLKLTVSDSGVIASWNAPQDLAAVDWSLTELRMGDVWESAQATFSGRASNTNIGWLKAGQNTAWAAQRNSAGMWSVPVSSGIAIEPPTKPLITGSVQGKHVTLEWQDCRSTQPLQAYRISEGAALPSATLRGYADGTAWGVQETSPGTRRYWVVAVDRGGNESEASHVDLTSLPSIDEAMEILAQGLDDTLAIITNPSSGLPGMAAAIANEALERAQAVAAEASARAQAIADEAMQRAQELAAEGDARASAIAAMAAQLQAQIDAMNAQLTDILGAEPFDLNTAYPAGHLVVDQGKLYRALQNTVGNPTSNPTYWKLVGEYASLGEAVIAQAAALQELTNRVDQDSAGISALGTAQTALAGRVTNTESGLSAQGNSISTLQNTVTSQGNTLASQGSSITSLQSTVDFGQKLAPNAVFDGGFEQDGSWTTHANSGWSIVAGEGRNVTRAAVRVGAAVGTFYPNVGNVGVPVQPGQKWRMRCWYKASSDYNGTSGNGKIRLSNQNNALLQVLPFLPDRPDWTLLETTYTIPASGVTALRLTLVADNTAGKLWVDDVELTNITDIEDVRAAGTANASAISALSSRVTSAEGSITSQSGQLTSLQNSVTSLQNTKADAAALNALQSTVTSQGNSITSHGTSITSLSNSLTDVTGTANAAARGYAQATMPASAKAGDVWTNTGLSPVQTYVCKLTYSSGGSIATNWQVADAAAAAAAANAQATANTKADSSAVSALQSTVEQQGSSITAHASDLTSLKSRMPAGTGTLATNADVVAETAARVAADNAQASSITSLSASLGATQSDVDKARARVDAAIAQAANAVLDPSFESNPTVWALSGRFSITTAESHTGTRSLQVAPASAYGTLMAANVNVQPGQVWRIKAWRKTTPDYNGTSGNGKLRLGNQAGALLGAWEWSAGDTWAQVGTDYTVPTSGAVTQLQVSLVADHKAGTLWLDDVEVVNITEIVAANTAAAAAQAAADKAQATADTKASSTALSALDSRVTAAEGTITSQGSSITSINNSLTVTTNTANAAAKSYVQATMPASAKAGDVWTNTGLSPVQTYVCKLTYSSGGSIATNWQVADAAAAAAAANAQATANTKADASALSALQSTVTSQGNTITSQGNSLVSLSNVIDFGKTTGSNAVFDGGFERDDSWTLGTGWSLVANEGRNGTRAAKRVGQSTVKAVGYLNMVVSNVPVQPGQKWRVRGWYKTTSDFNGVGNSKIRVSDQANNPIVVPMLNVVKPDWTLVEAIYTVAAGVNWLNLSIWADNTAGTLWVDDVELTNVTDIEALRDASSANSKAIQTIDSRVTAAEGTISSQGASITSLSNTVNNPTTGLSSKASSASVSALDSRVTAAEGTITSHGSSITSLQNSVTSLSNNKADASALNALQSTVTGQGNTLTAQANSLTSLSSKVEFGNMMAQNAVFDGYFERDDSWTWTTGSGWSIVAGAGVNGTRAARRVGTTGIGTLNSNIASTGVPVRPGQQWRLRVRYYTSSNFNGGGNSKGRLADQSNNPLGALMFTASPTYMVGEYIYTVPASGVTALRLTLVADNTAGDVTVDFVTLENVSDIQQLNASVTQQASTIASISGQLQSTWSLSVTAGKKISGMVVNNTGTASTMVFLADKFGFALNDGDSTKYPFMIGSVNGLSTVGINGALLVDGTAVIRRANIQDAAVDTLQVAGAAITALKFSQTATSYVDPGTYFYSEPVSINMPAGSSGVVVTAVITLYNDSGGMHRPGFGINRVEDGKNLGFTSATFDDRQYLSHTITFIDSSPLAGVNTYRFRVGGIANSGFTVQYGSITAIGGKR